ncbi:hypothetical protein NQ317_004471, partial [Molorchus minor]
HENRRGPYIEGRPFVPNHNVIRMIWSVMSCIHHFQLRLRTGTTGLIHYSRKVKSKKKSGECMKTYSKLIRIFDPGMHRTILNSIIVFYREGQMWKFEFACTYLIVDLLTIYHDFEEVVHDVLNIVEAVAVVNILEARILSMLEQSIVVKETDKCNYAPLKRGLELCLRNLISNLSLKGLSAMMMVILMKMNLLKDNEDIMVDFGSIVSFAASRYRPKTFLSHISDELFHSVNTLAELATPLTILVSSKIWVSLIDRNNNLPRFSTPKSHQIYLRDCDYKIKIKKCLHSDKVYFKSVLHIICDVALKGLRSAPARTHMESVFQIIAISLVETPCGYSAATYVSAILSVQDYAFKISSENLVRSHHLHAIVLSVISLICYIHKAEDHGKARRVGPHLNPPLKPEYVYAQHHILWNRPDLFFEDWETRYGLWKCFRVKVKPGDD